MLQFNPLDFIPQNIKDSLRNGAVDFVTEQAEKLVGNELSEKVKKLRSDAIFQASFDKGLDSALKRFAEEYIDQDEDLVVAIFTDKDFFKNRQIRNALLEIVKKPGAHQPDKETELADAFETVLPDRRNRSRVVKAIQYLLACIANEVYILPELQTAYSTQFQRISAQAALQQLELQKAELMAITHMDTNIRDALLQLSDAIANRKLLASGQDDALQQPRVFHNLPNPDYGQFVGRNQELAQILNILRPYPHSQHSMITVDGIGGIGKSALALEAAYRYLRNYDQIPEEERFEAIIWVSAKRTWLAADGIHRTQYSPKILDDVLTTIAVVLQREAITRARPEEQVEVVRNALTNQRTLLIVDNLETIEDDNLISFLRNVPAPTKVIVTTRHRIDVAYAIRLTDMAEPDAERLIHQECSVRNVTLNSNQTQRLIKHTAGIPLAIVWSISLIARGLPIENVLRRLGEQHSDIAQFCFEASFQSIWDTPANLLAKALAALGPDASRELLGGITELGVYDRDDGLAELERLSLVNRQQDRFRLLSLTRTYILRNLSPEETTRIRLQAIHWIINELFGGDVHSWFTKGGWQVGTLIFNETQTIIFLTEWALGTEEAEHQVVQLIFCLRDYLWSRGHWNKLTTFLNQGIEIARVRGDNASMVHLLNNLAGIYRYQGKGAESLSLINTVVALARDIHNWEALADATRQMGMTRLEVNDLDSGEAHLNQAMEYIEKASESTAKADMIAHILNNSTEVAWRRRDYDQVERLLHRTEAYLSEERINVQLVVSYRLRARLSYARKDYDNAYKLFLLQLEQCEKLGILQDEAYTLRWLSRVCMVQGRDADALSFNQRAGAIFTRLGMVDEVNKSQNITRDIEIRQQ